MLIWCLWKRKLVAEGQRWERELLIFHCMSIYIFKFFTYLKINFQLKQTWQNNMRYCLYLKSYSCISEQQTLFGTIILPTDILQQYIHCLKWDVFFKKQMLVRLIQPLNSHHIQTLLLLPCMRLQGHILSNMPHCLFSRASFASFLVYHLRVSHPLHSLWHLSSTYNSSLHLQQLSPLRLCPAHYVFW